MKMFITTIILFASTNLFAQNSNVKKVKKTYSVFGIFTRKGIYNYSNFQILLFYTMKYFLTIIATLAFFQISFSQSTVITPGGNSQSIQISGGKNGIGISGLTTFQRDAIPNPSNGYLIYNTTTNCLEFYNGSYWFNLCDDDAEKLPFSKFEYLVNGLQVTFLNKSQRANSYLWNFADGQTSTIVNPSKTFANSGTYNIELQAINSVGTNKSIQQITVVNKQWSKMANLPTFGRGGASTFSIGDYGYWSGGTDGTNEYNELWRYDRVLNQWTQKASMPTNKIGGVGFTINGIGYVSLGSNSDLYAYNPVTNTWTQKSPFPSIAKHGAVCFVIGNSAYIGLGYDNSGNVYSDFWEYNSTTDTWTQKANFIGAARTHTGFFSLNGKGYVGLGLINWNTPLAKDFYEYNPNTNTWAQKGDFPGVERYVPFSFANSTNGYIGGGEIVYPTTTNLSDFWEYNSTNDVWTKLSDYGGGKIHAAKSFVINNTGYVGAGGYGYKVELWRFD